MKAVSRSWREQNHRYRLEAGKCAKCGKVWMPNRLVCGCGGREFKDITLSGKGKLLTWTEVREAATEFEMFAPYLIGLIELEEGVKITAQLVDMPKPITAGMPLRSVFRKLRDDGEEGIILYGYKFTPA